MKAELDREQAQLLLPGMQKPYFIEYHLDDFATYEAVANYGALTREENGHQRIVRVTVRIGSYKTDSSGPRGDGVVQLAPTDNNVEAIRYSLWTATDEAYKNALRAYSTKNGQRIWEYDTVREFKTVNGVAAKGGSMAGPGPVVAGGMLFVGSGYVVGASVPGNVLLAFGP